MIPKHQQLYEGYAFVVVELKYTVPGRWFLDIFSGQIHSENDSGIFNKLWVPYLVFPWKIVSCCLYQTSRSWLHFMLLRCLLKPFGRQWLQKEMYWRIILEMWGDFKCTGSQVDWCTGSWYIWFKYDLGQKYFAPQVRPDLGSNSRSWQYIWCHWDTYSNHLAISDFFISRYFYSPHSFSRGFEK